MMLRLFKHSNLIIISLNILGFILYLYNNYETEFRSYYLLLFFVICNFKISDNVRYKFILISLFGIAAAFIRNVEISKAFAIMGLGFSVKVGYMIVNLISYDSLKTKVYESVLHLVASLAIWFAFAFQDQFQHAIHLKMLMLAFTMPNAFLYRDYLAKFDQKFTISPNIQENNVEVNNKFVFFLTPVMYANWQYALGFTISLYLVTFSILNIEKPLKYLIITLLILVQIETSNTFIQNLFCFSRGLVAYHSHPTAQTIQTYFIFLYILLKIVFPDYIDIYLLFAYLIMTIYIWKFQSEFAGNHNQLHHPENSQFQSFQRTQFKKQKGRDSSTRKSAIQEKLLMGSQIQLREIRRDLKPMIKLNKQIKFQESYKSLSSFSFQK